MSANRDNVSKYANLPGIAADQPDVYETNDLPEADQQSRSSRPSNLLDPDNSDNIEVLDVTPADAFKRFDGHAIGGRNVDFREIPSAGRGYQSWGDWESAGQDAREDETQLQKYHRIQSEVIELLTSLKSIKSNAAPSDNAFSGDLTTAKAETNLEALRAQIQSLDIDQWIESDLARGPEKNLEVLSNINSKIQDAQTVKEQAPLTSGSKAPVTYELFCNSDPKRSADFALFNKLDQKLKRLEDLIGYDEQKVSFLVGLTRDKNISESAKLLSNKVSQLDATHLDQIDGRLTSILQKLNHISEKKSALEDVDKQNKVVQLYELLQKSEQQRAALPAISERLNSLADVHEQAAQFSGALSYVDSLQSQIAEAMKNNESDLKKLNDTFAQNMDYLKKTLADYDRRINALQ